MAETTTRLTTAPSPSGGSSSAARPSVTSNDPTPSPPPNQITQPENSGPASGAMQRDYRISFWRDVFPRIASTCGILGLLLATILGVSQWLAQNQSIAISKESELITLALSCSDEVRTITFDVPGRLVQLMISRIQKTRRSVGNSLTNIPMGRRSHVVGFSP
ncbi:hypothetical protein F5Y14DRAFT_41669 [Nemania sp. NC0429]|nr:hypothetical protein F5Y14DRAFT_41669 [Nemania sp. NC0429]